MISPMMVDLSFTSSSSRRLLCVCLLFFGELRCFVRLSLTEPSPVSEIHFLNRAYRKEAAVRKQAPVACPGHSGLSLQQPIAKEQERHCQVWKERSGAANMQSERAARRRAR